VDKFAGTFAGSQRLRTVTVKAPFVLGSNLGGDPVMDMPDAKHNTSDDGTEALQDGWVSTHNAPKITPAAETRSREAKDRDTKFHPEEGWDKGK
jgi:hypothetical protein